MPKDCVTLVVVGGIGPGEAPLIPQGLEFADLVRQGNLRSLAAVLDEEPRLARQAQTSDGWTPLHLAAWFGHAEVCALLLSRGAKVDAESIHTWAVGAARRCTSPRCKAIGRWSGCSWAQGADPNRRDGACYTPLHHACEHGHGEVAELLLRAGADINALPRGPHPVAARQGSGSREAVCVAGTPRRRLLTHPNVWAGHDVVWAASEPPGLARMSHQDAHPPRRRRTVRLRYRPRSRDLRVRTGERLRSRAIASSGPPPTGATWQLAVEDPGRAEVVVLEADAPSQWPAPTTPTRSRSSMPTASDPSRPPPRRALDHAAGLRHHHPGLRRGTQPGGLHHRARAGRRAGLPRDGLVRLGQRPARPGRLASAMAVCKTWPSARSTGVATPCGS